MDMYYKNTPDNHIKRSLTTDILTESDALKYHQSLPGYQPTPLHKLNNLARQYGVGSIYMKDEAHRFGLKAFKALGASYAIYRILQQDEQVDTFCTATDGNHGRAVAWSAAMAGKNAVVFVPEHTTSARIKAIEKEGATVTRVKGNYDVACEIADETSQKKGWKLVQDTCFENYEEIPAYIVSGYMTMFRELEDELHPPGKPEVDIVFLQVGVGSFAASGIWYYLNRYGSKRPKIVLVEPYEADGVLHSLQAGKRSTPDKSFDTIMAGLNCGLPSMSAWEMIRSGADVVMSIKDELAAKAMRMLYHPACKDPQIIAGESGAAGLAGFINLMESNEHAHLSDFLNINSGSRILFVNTEGATDPQNFHDITSSK